MATVSIVIPLHNKASYVAETIASVTSQSFHDWEMIVVENGSTDGGPAIVEAIEDDRVRLVRSTRTGPGTARNVGIRQAKGKWIQFLDADDLLDHDHLDKMLAAAEQHRAADIIVGDWVEFDAHDATIRERKSPPFCGEAGDGLINSSIAFAPWAIHAAIIKRAALTDEFHWPEELDQLLGEDITFWFRLCTEYKCAYGKTASALYRYHTEDCRTRNDEIRHWYRGVDAAIQTNLEFLHARGTQPSVGQCETLMRNYSELHLQARRQSVAQVADASLDQAMYWMSRFWMNRPQSTTWPLQLRRVLGLRLFLGLHHMLSSFRGPGTFSSA